MLELLENSDILKKYNVEELKNLLNKRAQMFIEKDETKWSQYCWKPSVFVRSPKSLFYPGNEAAIEIELDFILNKSNDEGIWDINWTWGAYEKEFFISAHWWKANLIIENMLLLRNFGRL